MPALAGLVLAAAATTTTLPPPGHGLGLAPEPTPPPVLVPTAPSPGLSVDPPAGLGIALAGIVAAVADRARWRRRELASLPKPPPEVLVVFVPGYGAAASGTFEELIAGMGLSSDQVVRFDYRWVESKDSHVIATEKADIDELADGLNGFLAGVALSGRPVYLVGHSKGAVAIAEVIGRWDRRPDQAVTAVFGAALLDPPMAPGALGGALQSVGRYLPFLPNDGGYRPERCNWRRCRDTRSHLGEAAGLEVAVFRNPDAAVANFPDAPPGLRIYEVDDGEPEPSVLDVGGIARAHRFVLHSTAVAACILDELWAAGSCRWDRHQRLPARLGEWPPGWWR